MIIVLPQFMNDIVVSGNIHSLSDRTESVKAVILYSYFGMVSWWIEEMCKWASLERTFDPVRLHIVNPSVAAVVES